jgi:hypothetical protein
LKAPVWDVVWDLIIEGILRPGYAITLELPYIHVTEFGKEALKGATTLRPRRLSEAPLRNRPDGRPDYRPPRRGSAETFAVIAFSPRLLRLRASEKALLLVLDTYEQSLNTNDQPTFARAINTKRSIKLQHAEFKNNWFDTKLMSAMKGAKLNTDWLTEIDNALTFIFSYFRTIRNDAGHPTGAAISKEVAQGNLQMFPRYLRVLYEFMDWMNKTSHCNQMTRQAISICKCRCSPEQTPMLSCFWRGN